MNPQRQDGPIVDETCSISCVSIPEGLALIPDPMRALHMLCHASTSNQPQRVLCIGLPEHRKCALNGVGRFLNDGTDMMVLAAPGASLSALRVNLGRHKQLKLAEGLTDGIVGRFAAAASASGPGFHPQRGPVDIVEKRRLAAFRDQCCLDEVEAVCILEACQPTALIADIIVLCPALKALVVSLSSAGDGMENIVLPPHWRGAVATQTGDMPRSSTLIATAGDIAPKKLTDIIKTSRFAIGKADKNTA